MTPPTLPAIRAKLEADAVDYAEFVVWVPFLLSLVDDLAGALRKITDHGDGCTGHRRCQTVFPGNEARAAFARYADAGGEG